MTLAAVARLGAFVGADDAPLAFAVAFYPFCGFRFDEERLAAPLLLLLAERDDWTPSAPCVRQAQAWAATGQPVTWRVYEGPPTASTAARGRCRLGQAAVEILSRALAHRLLGRRFATRAGCLSKAPNGVHDVVRTETRD